MVETRGELRYTDPLDNLRGTSGYRQGPSPRERMSEQRRLDTPVPSWEDSSRAGVQKKFIIDRQRCNHHRRIVPCMRPELGEFIQ
jgi:hypothetical protein